MALVAFVLGLCAVIADFPIVFLAAFVVACVAEAILRSQAGSFAILQPLLFWDVLLVALLAQNDRVTRLQVCAVAVACITVSIVSVASSAVGEVGQRLRTSLVVWRNIDVPGIHQPRATPPLWLARSPNLFRIAADSAIYVGALAHCLGAPSAWLALGAVVAISAGAFLLTAYLCYWLQQRHRDVPTTNVLSLVAQTVRDMAPEVVLYLGHYGSGREAALVLDWVREMERVATSCVVVLRQVSDLDAVAGATSRVPILLISRARDVETLVPDTVRLGLYPRLDKRNDHLVRMPGIVDVLLGPVEVEFGGPVCRLARVYDEIWVSGPTTRDRYRHAGVVPTDASIREIGLPEPSRAPALVHAGPADRTRFAESVRVLIGRSSGRPTAR